MIYMTHRPSLMSLQPFIACEPTLHKKAKGQRMSLTLHTCNPILHLSAPSESSLEPSIEEGLATYFKSASHSPLKLPASPPLTQGETHTETDCNVSWHNVAPWRLNIGRRRHCVLQRRFKASKTSSSRWKHCRGSSQAIETPLWASTGRPCPVAPQFDSEIWEIWIIFCTKDNKHIRRPESAWSSLSHAESKTLAKSKLENPNPKRPYLELPNKERRLNQQNIQEDIQYHPIQMASISKYHLDTQAYAPLLLLSTGPLTFQIAALLVEVSPQIVNGLAAWNILDISGKYGHVCENTMEELRVTKTLMWPTHIYRNISLSTCHSIQIPVSLKPLLKISLSFEQLFKVLIEARDWPNLRHQVARRQVLAKNMIWWKKSWTSF